MPKSKTRRHCSVKVEIDFDVNLLDNETEADAEKFISGKAMEALLFEYGDDIEAYSILAIKTRPAKESPVVKKLDDDYNPIVVNTDVQN